MQIQCLAFDSIEAVRKIRKLPYLPLSSPLPLKPLFRQCSQVGAGERKIWPFWVRSVGAMVENGIVARVGCVKCGTFFDVDLAAVRAARGKDYSLIDRTMQCKITRCRGRAYFIAARSMFEPLMTLTNASMDPFKLNGRLPIDLEPPDTDPPTEPREHRAMA